MGQIRAYCVANEKLDKKQTMTLTEKNVLQKRNQYFPDYARVQADDSDNKSMQFALNASLLLFLKQFSLPKNSQKKSHYP